MALRSPALWMGNPAVQHPAQNDRLSRAGLILPETGQTASNRPLASASGVVAGPAGTMGEVTLLSNAQFTVNPARWLIQSGASALGGVYEVTNDAVTTLAVTAQNATQSRRSLLGVWVIDSFVAGSGDDLPHWGLIDGPLAASGPQLPAAGVLPANFLALGEFLIPPVGQAVTYTPYDLRTGARGGIVNTTTTDTRAGAYVGQYRDHPTLGLQRWNGTLWKKLPGLPTLIASTASLAQQTNLVPGMSGFPLSANLTVPAHAAGTLLIVCNAELTQSSVGATIAGYVQLAIGPNPTGQGPVGDRDRFHNGGQAVVSVRPQGYADSDGTAKYVSLLGWSDAGSNANVVQFTCSVQVWLL